jgi:hypothetical protein
MNPRAKYRPEMVEIARELTQRRISHLDICEHLGIGFSTFYQYCHQYPEFAEAVRKPPISAERFRAQRRVRDKRAAAERREGKRRDGGREKRRRTHYWTKYGVTVEEFERRRDAQGMCPICEKSFEERKAVLDHCHESGILRAVLCDHCNRSLGGFGDDPDLLARAEAYLRYYREAALMLV